MLPHITVAICVSVPGVRGKMMLLSGGTGFLAISCILPLALLYLVCATVVISSTFALLLYVRVAERLLRTKMDFLSYITFKVDLGHHGVGSLYFLGSSLLIMKTLFSLLLSFPCFLLSCLSLLFLSLLFFPFPFRFFACLSFLSFHLSFFRFFVSFGQLTCVCRAYAS